MENNHKHNNKNRNREKIRSWLRQYFTDIVNPDTLESVSHGCHRYPFWY